MEGGAASDMENLNHIAFIMDGNRRWADARGFSKVRGHKEGIYAIERVVNGCIYAKIPVATFFAFSTENWRREYFELMYLSRLMYRYLTLLSSGRTGRSIFNRVKITFIGDVERFGERNERLMRSIEKATNENSDCHVLIAVSYGGRDEIVRAVNKAIDSGCSVITKEDIENNLYAPGVPFPDMIVRTGNECRISNFLTWQSAYSEFLFMNKRWPDMNSDDVAYCKSVYEMRDRKFGL